MLINWVVNEIEIGFGELERSQAGQNAVDGEEQLVVGGQVDTRERPEENTAEVEGDGGEGAVGERMLNLSALHVLVREHVEYVAEYRVDEQCSRDRYRTIAAHSL